MHITPRVEKVLIKSNSVLKWLDCQISEGFVEKVVFNEKIVLFGTLLQSVSAVGFSGKAALLESVTFHSQMMGATNLVLVFGNCIVIAMIE